MAGELKIPDLPTVGTTLDSLQRFAEVVREILQVREGRRGNPLEEGVTFRDLVTLGIIVPTTGGGWMGGVGGPGPAGPIGPTGPAGTPYVPDYTTPPTPTGLISTSLFRGILIEWAAPTYSTGHGNAYTKIYVAQYAGSGPLPTFSGATYSGQVGGSTSIYVHDAAIGAQLHVWITFVSTDGVESLPAGGTNGEQRTVGTVGNSDLGPLVVSAEKLSLGTYPGMNMVPNPGSEDGLQSWAESEITGAGVVFSLLTGVFVLGGSSSFAMTKAAAADGAGFSSRQMAVIPGETYRVSVAITSTNALGSLYIRISESAAATVSGYVTGANRTSYTDLLGAAATPAIWTRYSYTYQVPAGVYFVSLTIYNWSSASNCNQLAWDDCSFGRQITAEHLAANSIAVGSLAVQNGAIANAMIANLAVDNAKIASMSVAKLLAGTLGVGESINGGAFTGYAWPVSGTGFHISANGLLLGNANTGPYFQVTAGGDLYTPTFNIVGGVANLNAAYISGLLVTSQIQVGAVSVNARNNPSAVLHSGSSVSSVTTTVDGPTFTVASVNSSIFGSVSGRIGVRPDTTTARWIRPGYKLQLVRVSDVAVMDESGIFGTDGPILQLLGVSINSCCSSLNFASVAAGTYKLRLSIVVVMTDAAGTATANMDLLNFIGEMSVSESKV